MSRCLNVAKIAGMIALMSLMLLGAEPPRAKAASEPTYRDCEGLGTCFIRVHDDGTITVYELGRLLAAD